MEASKSIAVVLGLPGWEDAQTITTGLSSDERFKIIAFVNSARELQERAETLEADVVIFSPRLPGMTVELVSELFHREEAPIASIGIFPPGSNEADAYYAHKMYRHLFAPVDESVVRRLSSLIPDAVFDARQARKKRGYVPLDRETLAEVQAMGWRRRSLAFWGIGGGVGKSTLALNTAAALGVLGQRPTLLLDLDMSRGALASYQPVEDRSKNIYPLVALLAADYQRTGRASCTPDLLRRYTVRLRGRLDLLPGIAEPQIAGLPEFVEDTERTQEIVKGILETARLTYDFIVVDLGPDVNNAVHYAALRWVEDVFTVVRPNRSDIESTARVVPALKRAFGQSYDGKFHFVVNQWSEEAGIPLKEIVRAIDMPLELTVPRDERMTYLLNRQEFAVLQKEIGPAADALVTLAAGIFPPLAPIWERRGGHIGGKKRTAMQHKVTRRKERKGWLSKVLRGEV